MSGLSEERVSGDETGNLQLCLDIAKRGYIAQCGFDWEIFRPSDVPSFSCDLSQLELEHMVRHSKLSSFWGQISYRLYHVMTTNCIFAYGYHQIENQFSDSSERFGVQSRFQDEYENFIFRLYAFGERLAQLSNIYHRRGLEFEKIRADYWDKLKKDNISDAFTDAVGKFRDSESVLKFMKLRKSMTHHFDLDLVGIGWPYHKEIRNEAGVINQVNLGTSYPGRLNFELALVDLRAVFSQVTQLLVDLEPVIFRALENH